MKKTILAVSLLLPMSMAHAQEKPISADEIRTLVTGKTLEFVENAQGYTSMVKVNAGGAGDASFLNNRNPRGNFNAAIKWLVNDKNELCIHIQRTGFTEKCAFVQKSKDGGYDRVIDGNVDSTFKVK